MEHDTETVGQSLWNPTNSSQSRYSSRPKSEEAIRRAKLQIRCQQLVTCYFIAQNTHYVLLFRFRELCEEGPPVQALKFLQTEVAAIVDHSTPETEVFRTLLTHLLSLQQSRLPATSAASSAMTVDEAGSIGASPATLQARTRVFESLLEFYPADSKEPTPNLVDVIDWYVESAHE
jgi:muskelin